MAPLNMLHFRTGNRLELLAADLVRSIADAPLSPLERELIVVPTRGIAQWLEYEIADAHAIAASIEMPFPESFVASLSHALDLGVDPREDPYEVGRMRWWLHDRFHDLAKSDHVPDDLVAVKQHLADDDDGRKRYQLAHRLAENFARYQLHRPHELRRWEQSKWFDDDGPLEVAGEIFQRALWRELREASAAVEPLSERMLALQKRLHEGAVDADLLPRRLTVFGASSLPRIFLELLVALSQHLPVTVYSLLPSPEFLADLKSRRKREADEALAPGRVGEDLVGELGRMSTDFFSMLLDLDESGQAIEETGFERPEASKLLGGLQAAIHDLDDVSIDVAPDDRSVRVLNCHSPLREMEVLRDEILRAIEEGVVDAPSEVLLLVPDMGVYGPLARSVLGAPVETSDGSLRIPIRIADRPPLEGQPYARFLLAMLDLATARRTLAEVFELLQNEVVAPAFDLDFGRLESVRQSVRDAGVRWGEDPEKRGEAHELPVFAGGSWREGLDRLLLGFCVGGSDQLVAGLLPARGRLGSQIDEVAQLARAVRWVHERADHLVHPRPLRQWVEALRRSLLEGTVAVDERDAQARRDVLEVFAALENDAQVVGAERAVGRLAVRSSIEDALRRAMGSRTAFGGEVRVAELRPMRSLPAQLIAVAGLDAETFPRRVLDAGLDLVAAKPRRGDRNVRDDDRQLFLELLLSARRRLLLSHVGQSHLDSRAQRARSSCLEELLVALDRMVHPKGDPPWLVAHRLQPFCEVYGRGDSERFTYDAAMIEAAEAMRSPTLAVRVVDGERTPEFPNGRITLDDLATFWKNPSKWYCRRVLDLALRFDEAEDDSEVLVLDALRRHALRRQLIEAGSAADEEVLSQAIGLPESPKRPLDLAPLRAEIRALEELYEGPLAQLERKPVAAQVGGLRIEGEVTVARDGKALFVLPVGDFREHHQVDLLVRAVVWMATGAVGDPGEVVAYGHALGKSRARKEIRCLADAQDLLAALVDGFVAGHTRPLHFFPKTSLGFAKEWKGPEGGVTAVEVFESEKVAQAWRNEDAFEDWDKGDSADEAVALCTRGLTPVELCDEEFVRWATFFAELRTGAGLARGRK